MNRLLTFGNSVSTAVRQLGPILLVVFAFASITAAQSAAAGAQAGAAGASLSADTTIDAELTHALDARKLKAGDEVTARVRNDLRQDGKVVLRRGTKLVGHITQAQAKANGQADSELGIIFDRAELKGGDAMDLHAAIQALGPAATYVDESGMSDVGTSPSGGRGGAGEGGGGAMGGLGNTVGGAGREVGGAVSGAGNAVGGGRRGGRGTGGPLNASSRGVIGLPGIRVSDELSNSTNGTVLVSNNKDIRLDSGTQMVLRVMAGH